MMDMKADQDGGAVSKLATKPAAALSRHTEEVVEVLGHLVEGDAARCESWHCGKMPTAAGGTTRGIERSRKDLGFSPSSDFLVNVSRWHMQQPVKVVLQVTE